MMSSLLRIILLFLSLSMVVLADKHNVKQGDDGPQGKGHAKDLKVNFYESGGCSGAEDLVRQVTWERCSTDPNLPAKLLRLHFHDCFVRGCDASVLLDSTGSNNKAEKDAVPNLTLGGFEVIDEIKTLLEQKCQGIVSCADILALAARDAVSFQFQKTMWDVPTGRKDGRVSLSAEADADSNLPSAFSNIKTLQNIFKGKGLDNNDLVALSGAHTIGVSHCAGFSQRLYNFSGKGDTDPSLDPNYASTLKENCPNPANPSTTVGLDPGSSQTFDTHYFTAVLAHQGIFETDAALLTDPGSAALVGKFQSQAAFFYQFGKSMVKMGRIQVLLGKDGEVRKNCHVVN